MHQIARVALAIAVLVLGTRADLSAQTSGPTTPKMSAINALIDFRLHWINDSTTFDACSVYRAAGASPQRVADELFPGIRDWFTASAKPCSDASVDPNRDIRVIVDSLSLSDSTGRAYITVRRGEQTHEEEYYLVNRVRGLNWAVDRVVLSGAIRNYWVRQRSGTSTAP